MFHGSEIPCLEPPTTSACPLPAPHQPSPQPHTTQLAPQSHISLPVFPTLVSWLHLTIPYVSFRRTSSPGIQSVTPGDIHSSLGYIVSWKHFNGDIFSAPLVSLPIRSHTTTYLLPQHRTRFGCTTFGGDVWPPGVWPRRRLAVATFGREMFGRGQILFNVKCAKRMEYRYQIFKINWTE
jgi:hypothetical protein